MGLAQLSHQVSGSSGHLLPGRCCSGAESWTDKFSFALHLWKSPAGEHTELPRHHTVSNWQVTELATMAWRSCKAPQTVPRASEMAKIKRKLLLVLSSPRASRGTTGRTHLTAAQLWTATCFPLLAPAKQSVAHRKLSGPLQRVPPQFTARANVTFAVTTLLPQQAPPSSLHSPFTPHNTVCCFLKHIPCIPSVPRTNGMKERTRTFAAAAAAAASATSSVKNNNKIRDIYLEYFLQFLHSLFIGHLVMDCLATVFNH